MRTLSIKLLEVPDTDSQYRRPYKLTFGNTMLNRLDRLVVENQGGTLARSEISDSIANALTIATGGYEEDVAIIGGWNQKRFRFVAEIETTPPDRYSGGASLIVTGYTDRIDISRQDVVSKDTKMFINNILGVRYNYRQDSRGNSFTQPVPVANIQCLLGSIERTHGSDHSYSGDVKLRPVDVYTRMADNTDNFEDSAIDSYESVTSHFLQAMAPSSRDNNISGAYLAKILNSDISAGRSQHSHGGDDSIFLDSRNNRAAEHSRETPLANNRFIEALVNHGSDLIEDGYFYYEELAEATETTFNRLDSITDVRLRPPGDIFVDDQESWLGDNADTIIATRIAQAVPAIMLDTLIGTLSFICSNIDGRFSETEYHFDLLDEPGYLLPNLSALHTEDIFEQRFMDEIFKPLSNFGELELELSITADVYGMTVTGISVSGDKMRNYSYPSFCDSLGAPTLTSDTTNLDRMADSMTDVRDAISSVVDDLIIDQSATANSDRRERGSQTRRSILDLLED